MTSSYGDDRYGEIRRREQAGRPITAAEAYQTARTEAERVEANKRLQRDTPAWYEAYIKATKRP